jgi:hypothetical protein
LTVTLLTGTVRHAGTYEAAQPDGVLVRMQLY